MGQKTSKAKTQIGQHHVEAFKMSGLTRLAYCRKHRIPVSRLDYWRRKLSDVEVPDEAAKWVPVTIAEEAAEADPGIQLLIGKLRIELHPGFDPKFLSEILRAVGSLC